MDIIIEKNYSDMSCKAAKIIYDMITQKPESVICLPTGSTPLGTYKELIRIYKNEKLDFSKLVTFNLDEYVGISPEDVNSYHYYMFNNFFNHININIKNIHIPCGFSDKVIEECNKYDNELDLYQCKDILLTGIGENGHIGFNEPGEMLFARTHIARLSYKTRKANSILFNSIDEVSEKAITMGISDIMHYKKIILIANGKKKAPIIADLLKKQIVSTKNTSSLLLLHNDVTVVLDEEAAELL